MSNSKETNVDKQARVFAQMNFQKHDALGLVEQMDKVSRARNWRGAVAKRFRMAVCAAMETLRTQKARR